LITQKLVSIRDQASFITHLLHTSVAFDGNALEERQKKLAALDSDKEKHAPPPQKHPPQKRRTSLNVIHSELKH